MIRNDEQFRDYFYLWLLSDFVEDFNFHFLEKALKGYLMRVGYNNFHDLDILKLYYFEKGRI